MRPDPSFDPAGASADWLERASLALLRDMLVANRAGPAAVVSSFGADSAVLLHLVARVCKDAPVLFIDTQMMFQETLDYQVALTQTLGLTDIRTISARTDEIRRADVFGRLHLKDPDACCHLRKVMPLARALEGFSCWINGRKRHQGANRAAIRPFETDAEGRVKVNPLAHWDRADIDAYFARHALPRHPLVGEGFTSIGCAPCTAIAEKHADPRAGRWAGRDKTECGIHVVDGRVVRGAA